MDIDIDQLVRLMKALEEHDFSRVEIVKGDERITLERPGNAAAPAWPAGVPAFPMPTAERERPTGMGGVDAAAPAPPSDPSLVAVTSPLVGTFYRAPSPDARPFVEVGSHVRKGTVLCIIEAFKLMNEIECEVDGTVAEILVENGKPVEFGQALLRVRRAG